MVKKIKHHWRIGRPSGQISPLCAEIIGAADDRGVLNVGGRLGAGHGPQAARAMFANFMLGMCAAFQKVELYEGIDTPAGSSIAEGHSLFRAALRDSLKAGAIPIAIGGGHDYGYPHFGGVVDAIGSDVALINVDAHLDVRPPASEGITSGSPFYLALEEGILKPMLFTEFGIQSHCNDCELAKYVLEKGAKIVMLDEARKDGRTVEHFRKLIEKNAKHGVKTVVSFDLDAVQMAFAPGVSAPQADGFTPAEFLAMVEACGRSPWVASVGFFELAPPLDEGQRTTRLVATALHRFLSAFSQRAEKTPRKRSRVRSLLSRK